MRVVLRSWRRDGEDSYKKLQSYIARLWCDYMISIYRAFLIFLNAKLTSPCQSYRLSLETNVGLDWGETSTIVSRRSTLTTIASLILFQTHLPSPATSCTAWWDLSIYRKLTTKLETPYNATFFRSNWFSFLEFVFAASQE